jgi:Tol biopolymer transport system component
MGVALVVVWAPAAAAVMASSAAGNRGSMHGILFVHRPRGRGEGGDIYNLIPGRGVQRLTHSSVTSKFDPQWSPSGNEIAYTAMEGKGLEPCGPCIHEVWVARADGSHPHQKTSSPQNNPTSAVHPSWSPDGSRIVFERDSPVAPPYQLRVVSVRAGRETNLGITGADPTWGKRGIAYVAGNSIRLIRPDEHRSTLFAVAPNGVAALAWSRDDRLAALEGSAYGRHVVIFSGSGRQLARFPLPARLFGALGITWSPDGKHLLLSAWVRGARPGLYETDVRGKTLRHVVLRINDWRASWR